MRTSDEEKKLTAWSLFSGKALNTIINLHPEIDSRYFENSVCGALFDACTEFVNLHQGKGVDRESIITRASELLKDTSAVDTIRQHVFDLENVYLDSRKIFMPEDAGKVFSEKVIHSCNLRRLKKLGQSLVDISDSRAPDALAQYRGLVSEFDTKFAEDKSGLVSWTNLFLQQIERMRKGETRHVQPTGFLQLDSLLNGGFYDGTFNIISGRPASGKTSLAINIAGNIARDPNARGSVVVYSLEMTNEDVMSKLFCYFAGRSIKQILKHPECYARLGEEFKKLGQSKDSDQLNANKLILSDRSSVTVEQMRSELTSIKKENGLSAVIVDYVGLMHSKGRYESRNVELGHITFGLRAIAKDLQIPMIVLAQMSRQGEGEDGTPKASFLRDSGSLEQDADTIIMLTTPDDPNDMGVRTVKLHIVKNRFNAVTGGKPLNLEFDGASNTFREMGRNDLPPIDKDYTGF